MSDEVVYPSDVELSIDASAPKWPAWMWLLIVAAIAYEKMRKK